MKSEEILRNIQEAKELEELYFKFLNLCENNWDLRNYLLITDKVDCTPKSGQVVKKHS
jgi:hypothetical protein